MLVTARRKKRQTVEQPNRGDPASLPRSRSVPSLLETALAVTSAVLLVLAFPSFELWWLAWIGLTPLVFAVARTRKALTAFLLGWLWGVIFFYGTCWWLTYPMIHYGHVPSWLAYPLLLLPVILGAIFPGLACAAIARVVLRFGSAALLAAPLIWVSFEWLRYGVTGQLWNALGYSQAFHPAFIQPARWGGVYAVSFILVSVNAALVYALWRPTWRSITVLISVFVLWALATGAAFLASVTESNSDPRKTVVVSVQPNVPMDATNVTEQARLLQRHLDLSTQGLSSETFKFGTTRVVIWPESPMNFSYTRDPKLRETVEAFARQHQTSVLLNSLEPAPNSGSYNSALGINEEGRIVAQYDKIRLMPFGEYVPLPQWLPGASSVRGIVGEFTPGSSYTLMPLGAFRAGVFICIEAAHPAVARSFSHGGADVLINISNDGYLGPTPVMRQHLANAVFRAVENNRPLLRVTNNGISAQISPNGSIQDLTAPFAPTVRTWTIGGDRFASTFYTRHGDVFTYACALISLGFVSATFMTRKRGTHASGML